jgi:hypothetical protein
LWLGLCLLRLCLLGKSNAWPAGNGRNDRSEQHCGNNERDGPAAAVWHICQR